MSEQQSNIEADKARSARGTANAALLFVGILFVFSHSGTVAGSWMPWLQAFSEAALVGALADWFAVVALFRHPLGIPIPHTAIIPGNQGRIAVELAEFIETNFLDGDGLQVHLEQIGPARSLGVWLENPQNRLRSQEWVTALAGAFDEMTRDPALTSLAGREIVRVIEETPVSNRLADLLDALRESDREARLLGTFLEASERYLLSNRDFLREWIRTELPWYVPSVLHRQVFEHFFEGVRSTLEAVNRDPAHPLREKLENDLLECIRRLKTNSATQERVERWKQEALRNPAWEQFISQLVERLRGKLGAALGRERGAALLSHVLDLAGERLRTDVELQAALDRWFIRAVRYLVQQSRHEVRTFIAQTISRWDPLTITSKIEQQVGRDLQFIRLNGTLVGGLIGLVLYLLKRVLAGD